MKVLITDNETAVRSSVRALLTAYCPEVSAIEEASGVQEGLQKINQFQPDVLLLDVEMEDGMGFDLLKQIKYPNFQLIFITAHNEYAVEAFQFSAIDYLLKPVDPSILQRSLQRAAIHIRNNSLHQQVEILLQQLSGIKNQESRIVLKDFEHTYFIRVNDILYCEADGTYTKFYLSGQSPILVSKNLKEYEILLQPLGFLRTHNSFLANRTKIRSYDKSDGGTLLLEGGHSIPVSQRKKESILSLLEGK